MTDFFLVCVPDFRKLLRTALCVLFLDDRDTTTVVCSAAVIGEPLRLGFGACGVVVVPCICSGVDHGQTLRGHTV